ncbi:MAG: 4Fe-4S single cluster domain-containing protein [Deltaproteobacteria bacterium]
MGNLLNIHGVLKRSMVNGPGTRLVVFFQGCDRGCPGCFNPDTHSKEARTLYSAEDLIEAYLMGSAGQAGQVEGLTVSGGEPFMQSAGLGRLLFLARTRGLSTLVYTGYLREELRADPDMARPLEYIDVLIDGPFIEGLREPTLLARGSTNQRVHLLTGRYKAGDLLMPGRSEITISPGGIVTETGFSRTTPRELII